MSSSMTVEKITSKIIAPEVRVSAFPDAAVYLPCGDSFYTLKIKTDITKLDSADMKKCFLWSSITVLRLQRNLKINDAVVPFVIGRGEECRLYITRLEGTGGMAKPVVEVVYANKSLTNQKQRLEVVTTMSAVMKLCPETTGLSLRLQDLPNVFTNPTDNSHRDNSGTKNFISQLCALHTLWSILFLQQLLIYANGHLFFPLSRQASLEHGVKKKQ